MTYNSCPTGIMKIQNAILCCVAIFAVPFCLAQPRPTPAAAGAATGVGGAAATPLIVAGPTTAPGPKLPTSGDKQNPTPTAAQLASISDFVKVNMVRLVGDDTDVCTLTRNDLIAASVNPSQVNPASSVYYQTFLQSLSTEIKSALTKKYPVRVRLNIAIVVARVCDNVKSVVPPGAQMDSIIVQIMKDPVDSISLWGMKAAAASLSAPGNQGANFAANSVLQQIVPVLVAHKFNGAMTEEAYAAFADVNIAANKPCIAALQKIFKARIDLYKAGTPPQDPAIDYRAAAYLVAQKGMWAQMNSVEQAQTMKMIADLVDAGSSVLPTKDAGEVGPQLRILLSQLSGAVMVVSGAQNKSTLTPLAGKVHSLSATSPVNAVVAASSAMSAQIRVDYP